MVQKYGGLNLLIGEMSYNNSSLGFLNVTSLFIDYY